MNSQDDLKGNLETIAANLDPMQHLKNLDFPRRSGTDGEKKAAAYIAQVLGELGYEAVPNEFRYSKPKLRSKIIAPLVILIWLILSLANIRFWDSNLLISLFVLALPLALILTIFNFGSMMNYFRKKRMKDLRKLDKEFNEGTLDLERVISSRNVIAEIGAENAEQQILFTAHFDSISSKIPMRVMGLSMMLGFLGLITYSVFYALSVFGEQNFIQNNFLAFLLFAAVLALLLGIFFASRSLRSNESHGIIDDGTGVAILLELAKFLKENPISGYKFIFGFYGSEESGLIGSLYDYMNRSVDKNKLRVITVDMIGEKAPLAYVKGIKLVRNANMDTAFNEEIASIAETLNIEIEAKTFPYPGSDFAPFMLDGGCTANWFINGSRLIHSKNDHLGNVDETLVNDALNLIVAYFLKKSQSI